MRPLLNIDIEHILLQTGDTWQRLAGKTILVTGGTGFFGKWLLESWVAANRRFGLGGCAWVVSRQPEQFLKEMPHLAGTNCLEFVGSDVREFKLPSSVVLDYVVHLATPASVKLNVEEPLLMLDIVVEGARHMLEVARAHGRPKVLMVSSGAAYGPQPRDLTLVSEDYSGAPDPLLPLSAYGEGKRQSELLCTLYSQRFGLPFAVARCFSFAGPHLPMDGTFAIGNFVRDARAGGPLVVRGDGRACRSYLYAADLAVWLWRVLVNGAQGRAYNIGSGIPTTIGELAHSVAGFYGCGVEILGAPNTAQADRYVPSVERVRQELNLAQCIDLQESIRRTENYLNGDA